MTHPDIPVAGCTNCGLRLKAHREINTGKCEYCRNEDEGLITPRCDNCGDQMFEQAKKDRGTCASCCEDRDVALANRFAYDSFDQCVLDIMANTDAPYLAALVAAGKVYHENWQFVEAPPDRGVAIAPPHDPDRHVIIRVEC